MSEESSLHPPRSHYFPEKEFEPILPREGGQITERYTGNSSLQSSNFTPSTPKENDILIASIYQRPSQRSLSQVYQIQQQDDDEYRRQQYSSQKEIMRLSASHAPPLLCNNNFQQQCMKSSIHISSRTCLQQSPEILSYKELKQFIRGSRTNLMQMSPTSHTPSEIQKIIGDLKSRQLQNNLYTEVRDASPASQSIKRDMYGGARGEEEEGESSPMDEFQLKSEQIVRDLNNIQLQVRSDLVKKSRVSSFNELRSNSPMISPKRTLASLFHQTTAMTFAQVLQTFPAMTDTTTHKTEASAEIKLFKQDSICEEYLPVIDEKKVITSDTKVVAQVRARICKFTEKVLEKQEAEEEVTFCKALDDDEEEKRILTKQGCEQIAHTTEEQNDLQDNAVTNISSLENGEVQVESNQIAANQQQIINADICEELQEDNRSESRLGDKQKGSGNAAISELHQTVPKREVVIPNQEEERFMVELVTPIEQQYPLLLLLQSAQKQQLETVAKRIGVSSLEIIKQNYSLFGTSLKKKISGNISSAAVLESANKVHLISEKAIDTAQQAGSYRPKQLETESSTQKGQYRMKYNANISPQKTKVNKLDSSSRVQTISSAAVSPAPFSYQGTRMTGVPKNEFEAKDIQGEMRQREKAITTEGRRSVSVKARRGDKAFTETNLTQNKERLGDAAINFRQNKNGQAQGIFFTHCHLKKGVNQTSAKYMTTQNNERSFSQTTNVKERLFEKNCKENRMKTNTQADDDKEKLQRKKYFIEASIKIQQQETPALIEQFDQQQRQQQMRELYYKREKQLHSASIVPLQNISAAVARQKQPQEPDSTMILSQMCRDSVASTRVVTLKKQPAKGKAF